MKDVIIIGSGPAGLSAALYTCRAKLSTLVIGKDGGALEKAEMIENYFGLEKPLPGRALLDIGRAQAQALGTELLDDEVVGISLKDGGFSVDTAREQFEGRTVILATGAPRKVPAIPGITDFEGRGVSYCAVCDAFFFRGRDIAVLGSGSYALHELEYLLPLVNSAVLLTNGEPLSIPADPVSPLPFRVITDKIAEVSGGDLLETVTFENGETLQTDGLFVALGTAGALDLARKLGAVCQVNAVAVDENMATNIPGFFAAGDCTGGLLQVSTAVAEGARAALSAISYLRSQKI